MAVVGLQVFRAFLAVVGVEKMKNRKAFKGRLIN